RERVAECAAAVKAIQQRMPAVESLRDVSLDQFPSVEDALSGAVLRRARHIVTETARVGQFVGSAERGLRHRMGRLMVDSHRSLQHDYEVSCPELDFLVDRALEIEGVFGSRMTGGGFGGCTVTMLRPDAVPGFRQSIAESYAKQFGVTPSIYPCVPSAG